MFSLCSVDSKDLSTVFGDISNNIPPKYNDLQVILIGQKYDCTGYLLLSNMVVQEFTKHNSVPEGYDFIFRQSWGLTINEEIIHRVISTLRQEAYPPMADYLDAIVKGDDVQRDKYISDCLAVKAKYPKFSWT